MINTRRAPFLSTATMSAPRGAEHVQCVTQIGPAGVPEAYQAECHGVRVDFDIRERILTRLGPCLLDFDGERFTFVKREGVEEA